MSVSQSTPSAADGRRLLLHDLLDAYAAGFAEIEAGRFRFPLQRTLTRRFLNHHARVTVDTLERGLHAQAARGQATTNQALIDDLDHYRQSLPPPLSSFARTLGVLAIVLVAQLLGRLPLIPVVTGPERRPALGSLSDALDLDPGHIAKAVADLLGSPLSTICGAVATLSAAVAIGLWSFVPAFSRMRQIAGGPFYRGNHTPTPGTIEHAAQRLHLELACGRPRRQPLDLLVCWSVVLGCVSLGGAWYVAYLHGLFGGTPGFSAGSLGAYPTAVLNTEHPTALGTGGLALVVAGLALGFTLLRLQVDLAARRWLATRPLGRRTRIAFGAAPLVLVGLAVSAGDVAITVPGLHTYRDPRIGVRVARVPLRSLVSQPVLPFGLFCHPAPCSLTRVRVTALQPGAPLDVGGAPPLDLTPTQSIPPLADLRTDRVSGSGLQRRFGLTGVRDAVLQQSLTRGGRFAVDRSQIAAIPLSASRRDGDAASSFVATAFRVYDPLFGALRAAHSSEAAAYGIVFGDRDLRSLLSTVTTGQARTFVLSLTVGLANGRSADVRLPLHWR